jgi:hypothetical protein
VRKAGKIVISRFGKIANVLPHTLDMLFERGPSLLRGLSVYGICVRIERDFRIDYQVPTAWHHDNHVGSWRPHFSILTNVRVWKCLLKRELLAFVQPGLFEQIAQNELAPVALRLRGAAQRRRQVARFF